MTRNSVHPYRKPHSGENASRRYTYWPPALGIIAASSPYDSAPTTVRMPVMTQATSSQPGLPLSRAICADTMKMPEPIIEPTTTMVESYRPSPRLNSVSSSVAAVELAIGDSCITILPGFGIRDSGFGWGCGMRDSVGDSGCGIRDSSDGHVEPRRGVAAAE